MDPKDFVTYDQALALKKLGFGEDCLYAYHKGVFDSIGNSYWSEDEVYVEDLYTSYNSLQKENQLFENYVDAPTLTQAQKWLIKEKKYYVSPDADVSDCWLWEIVNLRNSDLICMWKQPNQPNHYNTYEEAFSAGITECLKILENEK